MKPLLLIIDDDKEFVADFTVLLEKDYRCLSASTGSKGLYLLETKHPDLVLLDLMFPSNENGIEILQKIKNLDGNTPVIMITDFSSIETAIEALKLGAVDYISKAPDLNELRIKINKILKDQLRKFRSDYFDERIKNDFKDIIGSSAVTQQFKKEIASLADNGNTILITGESGVGKELVARKLHELSDRKKKPFIAINCSALTKNLIESELFGHERGAFTGAEKRKPGKFEIAEDGTLFLDEISELDPDVQVKLLRVLQEKEFQRVGGNGTIEVKCRIIAATNKELQDLVGEGKFREDLFYRLDVLRIVVPPLRERKDDIPELADYFVEMLSKELNLSPIKLSKQQLEEMRNYPWHGNIRELKNHITRLFFNPATKLFPVKESFQEKIPSTWKEMDAMRKEAADKASRKVEKLFLENLLRRFDGNISKAAKYIGINRSNLHKMIKKSGGVQMEVENF